MGQNATFNTFKFFLDNVLNSYVALGLLNDQVLVSEKNSLLMLIYIFPDHLICKILEERTYRMKYKIITLSLMSIHVVRVWNIY